MSESGEEYLEALWCLRESGDTLCRIKDIAQLLDVQPPSAVEMLKKLEKNGFVTYRRQKGIVLTEKGETKARHIVRAHRLMEVLLNKVIHIDRRDIEEIACSCEHAISKEVAAKLCTFLDHPRECPHGNSIPKGECCPE
jgi:DtxR family Mn-dependent transcriptional regulator